MSRNGARWLTAKVCSSPSAVMWRVLQYPPTLLTSTSIRGSLSSTSLASRRTCAWEDRSATNTSTFMPAAALISRAALFGAPAVPAGNGDVGAHRGQSQRGRPSDAGRGSGDQHGPAGHRPVVDVLHGRAPLMYAVTRRTTSAGHLSACLCGQSRSGTLNPLTMSQTGRMNSNKAPGTKATRPMPCVMSTTLNMSRTLPANKCRVGDEAEDREPARDQPRSVEQCGHADPRRTSGDIDHQNGHVVLCLQ